MPIATASLLGMVVDTAHVLQLLMIAAVLVLLVWRLGRGGGT